LAHRGTWPTYFIALSGFFGHSDRCLAGTRPYRDDRYVIAGDFRLAAGFRADHARGIYYGSQYGGSTTSILVNLPGEAASVVTTIDGYQMAKQGRAGAALAASAIGSFFAGTVATLLIAAFAHRLPKSRLNSDLPIFSP
jgi:hypothetical protein